MPETYQKKCIRCGRDMAVTLKQMHKKRCNACAIEHSRETSLKRYYLIKANPEVLTQDLHCEDCGIVIARNHNRKLCGECSKKRTRARVAAYQSEIAAGVRQKPKYCMGCGAALTAGENEKPQKYCPDCAVANKSKQPPEPKQRPAPLSECKRTTCAYFNKSCKCCDYYEKTGIRRGHYDTVCDKYKSRNDKTNDGRGLYEI